MVNKSFLYSFCKSDIYAISIERAYLPYPTIDINNLKDAALYLWECPVHPVPRGIFSLSTLLGKGIWNWVVAKWKQVTYNCDLFIIYT